MKQYCTVTSCDPLPAELEALINPPGGGTVIDDHARSRNTEAVAVKTGWALVGITGPEPEMAEDGVLAPIPCQSCGGRCQCPERFDPPP